MRIETKSVIVTLAVAGAMIAFNGAAQAACTVSNPCIIATSTASASASPTPSPSSSLPIIGDIDFRPRPGGELVLRGPGVGEIESAEIDGEPAEVTPEDDETAKVLVPEGVDPGTHDLVLRGPFGKLIVQDGIEVLEPAPENMADPLELPGFSATKPADCAPDDTDFSVWTQDQGDGSVLFFAKNVVGVGEVEFQQNGKTLKALTANSEASPNIRWGHCSPYFLHSFEREDLKNGLEIYNSQQRLWRAAYSGLGLGN